MSYCDPLPRQNKHNSQDETSDSYVASAFIFSRHYSLLVSSFMISLDAVVGATARRNRATAGIRE